ncbi:hypothetical protein QY95_01045 [Bacillus thermotolerans]|uniref:Uncharacterized protein n=1 Tax=Bacillus thermotolerans TaxID=1221996 RepID=A0A0F5I730_BACTR|nr:hypothetical protein QY95_01045 [Bacillus thermotolerans]
MIFEPYPSYLTISTLKKADFSAFFNGYVLTRARCGQYL